jgi:hypothetical protein
MVQNLSTSSTPRRASARADAQRLSALMFLALLTLLMIVNRRAAKTAQTLASNANAFLIKNTAVQEVFDHA